MQLETKVEKKIKRKTSIELLQEKVLEETNKKKAIAELAGNKKKKLWPILLKNPWIILGALLSSLCVILCVVGFSLFVTSRIIFIVPADVSPNTFS